MIVVTGSGGLIGSAVARMYLDSGALVAGIDNNARAQYFGPAASTAGTIEDLARDKNYVHFHADIRSAGGMMRVFECLDYVSAVVHCAAQPSHDWAASDPQTDFAVNANGTLNLLEAARQHCVTAPFVFMSTNKVYGDSVNWMPLEAFDEYTPIDQCIHSVFGASKAAADLMVQEYGRYFDMKTVCFRGGCLTGRGHAAAEQHGFLAYLVKCCRERIPYTIYGYEGKQVRDNIHANDVASAIRCFIERPSESGAVYNIGGGPENSITVREAISKAEEMTGKTMDVRYVDTPRKGDHKYWVTDMGRFREDFPEWRMEWSLDRIFEDLCNG